MTLHQGFEIFRSKQDGVDELSLIAHPRLLVSCDGDSPRHMQQMEDAMLFRFKSALERGYECLLKLVKNRDVAWRPGFTGMRGQNIGNSIGPPRGAVLR